MTPDETPLFATPEAEADWHYNQGQLETALNSAIALLAEAKHGIDPYPPLRAALEAVTRALETERPPA